MPFKRVTCPETAHLETLELEHHPLGILICACSRYGLGCEPGCTRRCAAVLDRRSRAPNEPEEATLASLASLEIGDDTRIDLDLDACFAGRRDS